MRDDKRRAEARKRAEGYAPKPLSSVFMYGVVGTCLAGLAWAAFTNFYELDPFAYPLWLGVALLLAFGASMVLRDVRGRRHVVAHRREYAKSEPALHRLRAGRRKAGGRN
jgi:hypothetical protein